MLIGVVIRWERIRIFSLMIIAVHSRWRGMMMGNNVGRRSSRPRGNWWNSNNNIVIITTILQSRYNKTTSCTHSVTPNSLNAALKQQTSKTTLSINSPITAINYKSLENLATISSCWGYNRVAICRRRILSRSTLEPINNRRFNRKRILILLIIFWPGSKVWVRINIKEGRESMKRGAFWK